MPDSHSGSGEPLVTAAKATIGGVITIFTLYQLWPQFGANLTTAFAILFLLLWMTRDRICRLWGALREFKHILLRWRDWWVPLSVFLLGTIPWVLLWVGYIHASLGVSHYLDVYPDIPTDAVKLAEAEYADAISGTATPKQKMLLWKYWLALGAKPTGHLFVERISKPLDAS